MRRFLVSLLLVVLSTSAFGVDAHMKIQRSVSGKSSLSLLDCSAAHSKAFEKFLKDDLELSGHFNVAKILTGGDISSSYLLPSLKSSQYALKYKLVGASLQVKLLQSQSGQVLFSKSYKAAAMSQAAYMAHEAISDINDALGYKSVAWLKQSVAFVRYIAPRETQIVVSDYTLSAQRIVKHGGYNLFVKWADRSHRYLFYSDYSGVTPALYRLDTKGGSRSRIASSDGMIICSDVNSRGTKLLLTMAPQGQTDIYEYNLISGSKRLLTHFGGIDVEGKYGSSDSRFYFVSNRLGKAAIYQGTVGTNAISRVYAKGSNNNAFDVANGKMVYVNRESSSAFGSNTFNIYYRDLSSGYSKKITASGSNQFPQLSFDGTVVQYVKHSRGMSYLGYMNVAASKSLLVSARTKKIQSIDW